MQDKQPLFTVIITTHNRRDILPRAIQSVLDQRYSNFECLVIDNGSTDDTADVIGKIQDERIHYISNPTPTQSCDAPRNLGIRLSKGDFISFLDDDDVWYPRKIEKVKSAFDLHTDIDAVCHNENMRIRGEIKGHYRYGPRQEAFYEKLLYQGNCLSPSAMTIRTGVLRQLNGFDLSEAFDAAADYDMWLRMAEQGKKIHFLVDV
jgi:glycosyltransferase involved in cell wall biosynthesis